MNKEKNMYKILQAASVYIGIILGAGFASGQEIVKFFISYDSKGIFGLILAGLIFSISGYAIMDICVTHKTKTYFEFLNLVFGDKLGFIIDIIAAMFIFIIFCAMFAGSGALLNEAINIDFTIGVFVVSIFSFITFLFDLKGVMKVNLILAPLLVIGGIFFGLYSFFTQTTSVFINQSQTIKSIFDNWIIAAITYSSYNIVTAISVLSQMSETVTNRKIAKYAGILGGLCLTLLGLSFALPLFIDKDLVSSLELPMLKIAKNHGNLIEILYIGILISAIFTTAISTGFSIIEWIYKKTGINKFIVKILVVVLGALFAHIGFSSFVGNVYPIFGYIGLFEIVAILIFFMYGRNNKKKTR